MYIERVKTLVMSELENLDFSFDVNEEAIPPFDGERLGAVAPVAPYTKQYKVETEQYAAPDPRQSMVAVAREENGIAGYILLSRAWNNCAQIDDFAIARAYRRKGLANALMNEGVIWSKEQDLPSIRLETQSNNIPACRFYEKYGFRLGGFDRYLYSSMAGQGKPEIALFWYLDIS